MNQLIIAANDFLNCGGFDYAICGGFALDIFTNSDTRMHSDIDVCVFERDKDIIFLYMEENGWSIYEFCGQGIVHFVDTVDKCQSGRNLMCLKDACELVKFYPSDRGVDYFLHEFYYTGINSLNYLEFLFNTAESNDFIFDGNHDIRREIGKAILLKHNVPFLAPEIVLLYKSRDIERQWYQYDYEKAISKMDNEQMSWFYNGLDVLYPNGHMWRKYAYS